MDKTGFALRLIDQGKDYFLSRPRRFGKSLFLDTLAELFAGNEPLFRGLQAHERWDWDRRHPVIRQKTPTASHINQPDQRHARRR